MAETERTEKEATNASLSPVAPQEREDAYQIDLLELFYRLIEKAKYIVAAALLGAVLAGAVTVFFITPKYVATSKLYVLSNNESAVNLSDLQIGAYLTTDYQEVFKNWHVHEMVLRDLDLPYTYAQLSDMLRVSNPSDTRILYISVTSQDPAEAKAIADCYAKVAREFIAKTMATEEPNLFEEALLPTAPASPSKSRNILIGFLLGALLAGGVVTLNFLVDDRVRTSEEITRYVDLPTLGAISAQKAKAVNTKTAARKHKPGKDGAGA